MGRTDKTNYAALLGAILIIACGFANHATAQTPSSDAKPVIDQTTWSPTSELVVRAPWPAMWRLKRGDSTLWVMATLAVTPVGQEWDSSRFKKLLSHAKVIILPDGTNRYRPSGTELPAWSSLKEVLPPLLYQRYEGMVRQEGLPMEIYGQFKPAWAGPFLLGAVFRNHNLQTELYPAYITVMAKDTKVPLRLIKTNPGRLYNYNDLDKAAAEVCLTTYLDYIEYNINIVPKMADAWAQSDIPSVLGYHRVAPANLCIPNNDPSVAAKRLYPVDKMVKAFDEALQTPGMSMAAVPLDWLLRKDGILDQLKNKSVEIRSPAE